MAPTLASLSAGLHRSVAEYLAAEDCKNSGLVCAALQEVYRPISWRFCQVVRSGSSRAHGDRRRRRVPIEALLEPQKYSWFRSASVRTLFASNGSFGDGFVVRKFQEAFPVLEKVVVSQYDDASDPCAVLSPALKALCQKSTIVVEILFWSPKTQLAPLLRSLPLDAITKLDLFRLSFGKDAPVFSAPDAFPNLQAVTFRYVKLASVKFLMPLIARSPNLASFTLYSEVCCPSDKRPRHIYIDPAILYLRRLPQDLQKCRLHLTHSADFNKFDNIFYTSGAAIALPQVTELEIVGGAETSFAGLFSVVEFPNLQSYSHRPGKHAECAVPIENYKLARPVDPSTLARLDVSFVPHTSAFLAALQELVNLQEFRFFAGRVQHDLAPEIFGRVALNLPALAHADDDNGDALRLTKSLAQTFYIPPDYSTSLIQIMKSSVQVYDDVAALNAEDATAAALLMVCFYEGLFAIAAEMRALQRFAFAAVDSMYSSPGLHMLVLGLRPRRSGSLRQVSVEYKGNSASAHNNTTVHYVVPAFGILPKVPYVEVSAKDGVFSAVYDVGARRQFHKFSEQLCPKDKSQGT